MPPRRAKRRLPAGLLLAPGASAGANQAGLVAIDEALSASPVAVARMEFPYTKAGRRSPDRPPVLLDSLRDEATAFAMRLGVGTESLMIGGRSMGGRIASMVAAD